MSRNLADPNKRCRKPSGRRQVASQSRIRYEVSAGSLLAECLTAVNKRSQHWAEVGLTAVRWWEEPGQLRYAMECDVEAAGSLRNMSRDRRRACSESGQKDQGLTKRPRDWKAKSQGWAWAGG